MAPAAAVGGAAEAGGAAASGAAGATAIEIVAHRGAGRDRAAPRAGEAYRPAAPPENTLPAFDLGWAAVGACELDVRLSRDGRVVVVHDATTGRTCDRDVAVGGATFAELRQLDAGARKGPPWSGGGLRLPALSEVLARMPAGARLYIEAKSGPEIVRPLLDDLAAAGRGGGSGSGEIVLISFGIDTIAALKRACPELPCYWVLAFEPESPGAGGWRAGWRDSGGGDGGGAAGSTIAAGAARGGAAAEPAEIWQPVDYDALLARVEGPGWRLDGLDVSWQQPDDFAEMMRRAGLAWGAWTVDSAAAALATAARGAIQLTSNNPRDVRAALAYAGVAVR